MRRILDLPPIVVLMFIGSAAMLIPAAHAIWIGSLSVAHTFGLSAVICLFITAILAIAVANYRPRSIARSQLAALTAAYTLLPFLLAIPLQEGIKGTTLLDSWFEMVSAITTTGATLYTPNELPESLHLWRALVGWMGGFLAWVSAIAILAPMNLGGFEVISPMRMGAGARGGRRGNASGFGDPRHRLRRYAAQLLPIYSGLTAALWLGLVMLGDDALVAACHAMSTLATSGISPIGGLEFTDSGLAGEAMIFVFFAFAISRVTFSSEFTPYGARSLFEDPEARIGIGLLVLVPSLLFLRHWVGAYEGDSVGEAGLAGRALWGSAFSVMSFLSTSGFVSSEWDFASIWSGLETPGMVLLGLCLVGGGVATTAGGVKLLRVYALYKHSEREMERLIYPSSVGGAGNVARRIRTQGAYVAWIFFMLFALSLATISVILSLTGVTFEEALVLGVAALSTTGPVANVVLDYQISYAELTDPGKIVLGLAMALGRLETLAILALFNPEFWRG